MTTKKNNQEVQKAQEVKKVEKSEFEKSLETIRSLVDKAKDLKLVEQEAKTGFSYFAGKKRLCKLLKSKKGVTLEVNVKLPKKFSEMAEVQDISAVMAHKKHLGTMKHLVRAKDSKVVMEIMKAALEQFKNEYLEAKKKEQEPQAKEA